MIEREEVLQRDDFDLQLQKMKSDRVVHLLNLALTEAAILNLEKVVASYPPREKEVCDAEV